MNNKENKSLYFANFAIGFATIFILVLIGITIEDFMYTIPLADSLKSVHHYITPLILGILGGILSWKRRSKMVTENTVLTRLKTERKKHQTLISNISDVICIVDRNGIVSYKSDNIEKLFGWKSEDLINKYVWETVHPDDLLRVQKEFDFISKKDNQSNKVQYRFKCKDGSYKMVASEAKNLFKNPIIKGLLINYHDITDQNKDLIELQRNEYKYRNLFENMPDVVCILDIQGHILDLNEKGTKLFEYTREEIINRPVSDIIYNEDKENSDSFFEELENKGSYEMYEGRIKTKSGALVWIQVSSTAIYEDGIIIGSQDIIRDISKRKEIENSLLQSTKELRNINAEKDKFFSIIAHDLKSPFNTFLGMTRIMEEEINSLSMDELQRIAASIRNSATKLFGLLENLLNWARSKQGLIANNPEQLQLFPLVKESMMISSEISIKKEISIHIDIENDLTIYADKNLFATILRNLISNALKFTHKQGNITIKGEYLKPDKVLLSVKDSGIGMSPKMLDDIFKLDVNTSRMGTEDEASSGLGLILCKEFAAKMNAHIWAESEENKGSIFYLSIPINQST